MCTMYGKPPKHTVLEKNEFCRTRIPSPPLHGLALYDFREIVYAIYLDKKSR